MLEALRTIADMGAEVLPIVMLSLRVSLTAVALACFIAFPLGAVLALTRFRGRAAIIAVVNTMMGLPPVVVGLCIYMLLSNSGPLAAYRLLFTPTAMILAQALLVLPIILALSRETFAALDTEYRDLFRSMSLSLPATARAILWDARFQLPTIALAGFGRAIAEVGAVIMVGGNIKNFTRVMTSAIALETSKGELELAISLGFVLLLLALAVNAMVQLLNSLAARRAAV